MTRRQSLSLLRTIGPVHETVRVAQQQLPKAADLSCQHGWLSPPVATAAYGINELTCRDGSRSRCLRTIGPIQATVLVVQEQSLQAPGVAERRESEIRSGPKYEAKSCTTRPVD